MVPGQKHFTIFYACSAEIPKLYFFYLPTFTVPVADYGLVAVQEDGELQPRGLDREAGPEGGRHTELRGQGLEELQAQPRDYGTVRSCTLVKDIIPDKQTFSS